MSDTDFIIPSPEHLREMRDRTVAAMDRLSPTLSLTPERKLVVADIAVRAMEEAMRAISRVVGSVEADKVETLAVSLKLTEGTIQRLMEGFVAAIGELRAERQL